MAMAHILGFPRIGKNREMKYAVESYWAKTLDLSQLLEVGRSIRLENWKIQQQAGLDFLTVGDFSWYDSVLDMAGMLGVIPSRFLADDLNINLDTIFRMARGDEHLAACEMTKWFNTNYHYIVPELSVHQTFKLSYFKLFEEIEEAKQLNHPIKPVLIGPLTFLWLAKTKSTSFNKLDFLDSIVEIYLKIFQYLKQYDIQWVQIDEPILGLDLPHDWLTAYSRVFSRLNNQGIHILLTSYFSDIKTHIQIIKELPINGLHVDLTQDPKQLAILAKALSGDVVISAGIVNGRNIWKNNFNESYSYLHEAKKILRERLWVATSCSLMHVPIDLALETTMEPEIKSWLAFAMQKIDEVVILSKSLHQDKKPFDRIFKDNALSMQSRLTSTLIHKDSVKEKLKEINDDMFKRKNSYDKRKILQKNKFQLPLFPTTTIGSFPQTKTIRKWRNDFKKQIISEAIYEQIICQEIQEIISFQESTGLDVLVHGEVERADMVEYFAEYLQGFILSEHGWIQSYGSRVVKPPILYGDVIRSSPITVAWIKYAQSLTSKPLKGMLTGPVTMLNWSFVREDQPLWKTAFQLALALREEIEDLENNDIAMIQIDEPAFREGLPLRKKEWSSYLEWEVKAFRLATSGVQDTTKIHSHMCYAEFNDIIAYIAELDADVIMLETSRSQMELFLAFKSFAYPNEIGPGVFDVHSPRVPSVEEMVSLLTKATKYLSINQIWVNPDCGLKTRQWSEVEKDLINMVEAAKWMRKKYSKEGGEI